MSGSQLRLVPLWQRHPSLRFALAVVVALAMRARFLFTPITSDEGGFLAIARGWSHGATLYRDVWVDRPQGLLLLYRAWDAIGLGSPIGIRLLATIACIVGAIACGIVAEHLFGRGAGPAAAVLVAALSSVPQYEGFIANGELLSGSIGAVGLAVALRACWRRSTPSLIGLFAAGALAGAAISVKQSGFDASVCSFAAVVWCCAQSRWAIGQRRAAPAAYIAGAAMVVGAMCIHASVTGWDRFWYAVAGYRLEQRSALHGANWGRLASSLHLATPLIVAAGILLLAGAIGWRAAPAPSRALGLVWIGAATAAFVSGGQFHRHYWVILAFPIGTVAAGTAATVRAGWLRVGLGAALVVSPIWMTARAIAIPRADAGRVLSDDGRLTKDEHIATWFEQRAEPGDEIYALCAAAGLYGNLSIAAPFTYLWFDNVRSVPGAEDALVEMFSSEDRPRFVAEYQSPALCDPSGRTAELLGDHYRRSTTIYGIPILERQEA